MPRKTPPHRGWPLTHFTDNEEDAIPQEILDNCDYACWAPETCPETGRLHIQAWCFFKTKRTFEGVKKLFDKTDWKGVHLEIQRGTHLDNIKYIQGPYDKGDKHKPVNDNFTESGVRPADDPIATYNERCGQVIKKARMGDFKSIEEDEPHLFLQYNRTLSSLQVFTSDRLTRPAAVWIQGSPEIGKSTLADSYAKYGQIYNKTRDLYWNGYKNEQIVLIDEFDRETMLKLSTDLKNWSDNRPFPALIKLGTAVMIRPKLFIVTSNYTIEELVQDEMLRKSLLRRFTIIEFSKSTRVRYRYDPTTNLYLDPPLPVGCTLGAATSPDPSVAVPSVVTAVADID